MSLAALRDVYNPLAPKPVKKQPLENWSDSASVVRLSEYLKQHKAAGIRLCNNNGAPSLVFNPGLTRKDMTSDRWGIGSKAECLMMDAAADLQELIAAGKITVPESKYRMTV